MFQKQEKKEETEPEKIKGFFRKVLLSSYNSKGDDLLHRMPCCLFQLHEEERKEGAGGRRAECYFSRQITGEKYVNLTSFVFNKIGKEGVIIGTHRRSWTAVLIVCRFVDTFFRIL